MVSIDKVLDIVRGEFKTKYPKRFRLYYFSVPIEQEDHRMRYIVVQGKYEGYCSFDFIYTLHDYNVQKVHNVKELAKRIHTDCNKYPYGSDISEIP